MEKLSEQIHSNRTQINLRKLENEIEIERNLSRQQENSFRNDDYDKKAVLFTSRELLDPNFRGEGLYATEDRVRQYFLRNGRDILLRNAHQFGAKHQKFTINKDSEFTGGITSIYEQAGIQISGKSLDMLIIPGGRDGGMRRDHRKYGGEKSEGIMSVNPLETIDVFKSLQILQDKGIYPLDKIKEWKGVVANELSHEATSRFFPKLFSHDNPTQLTEPFRSFRSRIPGLTFKHNLQADEFLSDVFNWKTGAYVYRFFHVLNGIHPEAAWNFTDRYDYSNGVLRYAMEEVLKRKGYSNAKRIVDGLIELGKEESFDRIKKEELYKEARKYFSEDEFREIAKIFEQIGIELLKSMKPYYQDNQKPPK